MIALVATVRYEDRQWTDNQGRFHSVERWVGVSYRMRDLEDLDYPLGGQDWVIRFQLPARLPVTP